MPPLLALLAATALPLPDEGGAPPPASQPNMWVPLVAIFAIFWFVMILPARRDRKKRQVMLEAVKKNDRVLTSGGLYATVAAVGEQDLTVKFDDGPTRVKMLKSAIASIVDGDDKDGGSKG